MHICTQVIRAETISHPGAGVPHSDEAWAWSVAAGVTDRDDEAYDAAPQDPAGCCDLTTIDENTDSCR
jgi:hypothetical protein